MAKQIFFNGALHPDTEKLLTVQDRGLCFGDGLFEVVRCVGGRFLLFGEHLGRMRESAGFLGMELPYPAGELLAAAKELSRRNEVVDGELYLELTRGEAPRYHPFPHGVRPNFFMVLNPLRAMPGDCWSAGVAAVTVPDIRWGYCHLKSIQLLPNVLGKQFAKEQRVYEALFHRDGAAGRYLTEGASSSVFAVMDGTLHTPDLDNILPGATRRHVLELARTHGIPVREGRLALEAFRGADEAFITSTVSEVMPVIRLDGQPLGGGRKAPVTGRLQQLYAAFKAEHLEG
jgi:D-alanine transaminase